MLLRVFGQAAGGGGGLHRAGDGGVQRALQLARAFVVFQRQPAIAAVVVQQPAQGEGEQGQAVGVGPVAEQAVGELRVDVQTIRATRLTVAPRGAFDHILQYAVGNGRQRERSLFQARQRLRGLQIAVAVGAYREHGDQAALAQRRGQ